MAGRTTLNGIHRLIDKRRDQLRFLREWACPVLGYAHIKIPWSERVQQGFDLKDYYSSLSLKLLIVFCDKQEKCVFIFSCIIFEAVFLMMWSFIIGYCTKEMCLQHIYNISVDSYSFSVVVAEEQFLLQFFLFVWRSSWMCTVSQPATSYRSLTWYKCDDFQPPKISQNINFNTYFPLTLILISIIQNKKEPNGLSSTLQQAHIYIFYERKESWMILKVDSF